VPAPRTSRAARTVIASIAFAALLTLTACAPEPDASPTPEPSSPAATATATPTPTADPGSAEALRDTFAETVNAVWDADESVAGRDYIDALVTAGFEKEAMQVTQDRTSVDNPADSIQFSVHIGEECLVGQVGPSVDGPIVELLPETPAATCLVGQTRPIDW
jgi:hypothetical protein